MPVLLYDPLSPFESLSGGNDNLHNFGLRGISLQVFWHKVAPRRCFSKFNDFPENLFLKNEKSKYLDILGCGFFRKVIPERVLERKTFLGF